MKQLGNDNHDVIKDRDIKNMSDHKYKIDKAIKIGILIVIIFQIILILATFLAYGIELG